MSYEVCALLSGRKDKIVSGPFSLIDSALDDAQKRSQTSAHDLIVVFVEADRYGQQTRTVRAFAVCGRVDWAKPCTKCDGRGHTLNRGGWFDPVVQVDCSCCLGVGSCPERGLTLRPPQG